LVERDRVRKRIRRGGRFARRHRRREFACRPIDPRHEAVVHPDSAAAPILGRRIDARRDYSGVQVRKQWTEGVIEGRE